MIQIWFKKENYFKNNSEFYTSEGINIKVLSIHLNQKSIQFNYLKKIRSSFINKS
jgi:hypothetical protein